MKQCVSSLRPERANPLLPMERTVVLAISLVLLTGLSYEALPPGPVIGAVGGRVTFLTSVDPAVAPVFQTIAWTFYDTSAANPSQSVIMMSNNEITIGAGYAGRVSLNTTTGALQLTNLTLKDNGQYGVLMVTNGNVAWDKNTTLNVYERISGISINGTTGKLIADSSNATLNCSETSGTGIVREWLKGGQQLLPSDRLTFSEGNASVFFQPVQSDDNGRYHCRLTNPVSTGTATYRLTVNYGPEHVVILGEKTAQVGSAMLLYCSALSVPAAAFGWTVNDTETEVNTAGYLIENSSYSHSGNYTCAAWNAVTNLKVSTVHTLLVTGKVTAPTCAGLTPGQIAGISVGVIAVVVILALAVYFGVRHGRLLISGNDSNHQVHLEKTRPVKGRKKSNISDQYETALDYTPTLDQHLDQQGTVYENTHRETPPIYSNQAPPLPPRDFQKETPSLYNTSIK